LASLEEYARVAEVRLLSDARLTELDWLAALGEDEAARRRRVADDEARCAACLRLRLREAARHAAQRAVPRFATTLTVSPYQRHDLIRLAGEAAGDEFGVEFLYRDLRPEFRHSYEESRRLGLYRQRYCGCVVSKWQAWEQRLARKAAKAARTADTVKTAKPAKPGDAGRIA
jgi:predicted adenine nucleotide alpha hydrolase (AANH) superfamily ATPase